MRIEWATVTSIESERAGIQHVSVELTAGSNGQLETRRAICYPALTGACSVGERVAVNCTACDMELGTGGFDFVVARDASSSEPMVNYQSYGSMMKLRYTPLQCDVLTVEDEMASSHQLMRQATDSMGTPVVCCSLHSQVVAVALAVKHHAPQARIAYVMTDEAALVLSLSNVVAQAVETRVIDTTITCGQAIGGELEAINLYSALIAARHVAQADVVIVGLGPGIAGTGSALGHGGVALGEAVNACASVGARAIACPRISFADMRKRHQGISHHVFSALNIVALASAEVVLSTTLSPEQRNMVEGQDGYNNLTKRHSVQWVTPADAESIDFRGISLTSMGRTLAQDPIFFETCFATGKYAAALCSHVPL